MPSDNNEEISKWMVGKQREQYRAEAEERRLAEHRKLDQDEKRLCGEIEQQEKLFTCAESEAALAREQFESAAARLDQSSRDAELLRFELSGLRSQLDQIGERRKRLSPPALVEFIAELWKQFDQLPLRTVSYERVKEMPVTGARTAFHLSNGRAVEQGLQTIRSIIDETEGLRVLPLSDGEIEARLAKLKSRMPDIAEVASQEERVDIPTPLPLNESPVRYA